MIKTVLTKKAIDLLQKLIKTTSYSGEEGKTAYLLKEWLTQHGIQANRDKNNVWAMNKHFDRNKPSILLNSHHDTVRPNSGYTRDPFEPSIEDGRIYGLGSNDAGGALVSLISTFLYYYEKDDLKYNLIFAATAEEETAGKNGLRDLLLKLPKISFALVGEPTEMHLAVAEKGLLVIDAQARGTSGHTAHTNTDNAIYRAIEDISWIKNFKFPKVSPLLGEVKMTVSMIEAGKQHNIVPAKCAFVIDVRVNEAYSNNEVFEIIDTNTSSTLSPRSFRLNSSSIPLSHPFVQAGLRLGRKTYGSPTLSDQACLSCPSLKMGPGNSLRSHQANEYILIKEIADGISLFIDILGEIV